MKPGPSELANLYLVMHQMMSVPREVGARTINQLALTFGTLLSSQSTGAHPWRSLDRLWGNLIYVTGWARQLQIVSAPTSREQDIIWCITRLKLQHPLIGVLLC